MKCQTKCEKNYIHKSPGWALQIACFVQSIQFTMILMIQNPQILEPGDSECETLLFEKWLKLDQTSKQPLIHFLLLI